MGEPSEPRAINEEDETGEDSEAVSGGGRVGSARTRCGGTAAPVTVDCGVLSPAPSGIRVLELVSFFLCIRLLLLRSVSVLWYEGDGTRVDDVVVDAAFDTPACRKGGSLLISFLSRAVGACGVEEYACD